MSILWWRIHINITNCINLKRQCFSKCSNVNIHEPLTGVLASDGWWEAWEPSAPGNQESLVVKTRSKDPRWAQGEQICGMWCFFPSVLWHCWLGDRKGIWPVKIWVVLLVVTIWLELSTSYSSSCHHYLHHSCSNKIQNGGIPVPANPGCPGTIVNEWVSLLPDVTNTERTDKSSAYTDTDLFTQSNHSSCTLQTL